MTTLISNMTDTVFFVTGFVTTQSADMLANQIAHAKRRNSQTPKEMLGTFFKSQSLKLSLFTILTLSIMNFSPDHAHWTLAGIIFSSFTNKFLFNRKEKYESKHAYGN